MKLILAYNPLPDIKKWALEKVLGYAVPDLNALSTGTDKEKKLFGKCNQFFGNFRKYFEQIVPVPAKFDQYNQIYSGALADLGKKNDSREGFFGSKFDLDKVDETTGNYSSFKGDCEQTSLVGHLNDALGTLTNNTFKNAMNQPEFKRKVNAEIQKFGSGSVGIEQFYNDINRLQNSMEKETGVAFVRKISKGDAWASIGSPVMSEGEYNCYCVRRWIDLNTVAGFSSWCVAQNGKSGRNYFDGDGGREPNRGYIHPNYDENGQPTQHINDKRNAYYLICKGKTPVALFNIGTKGKKYKQFKNVGDEPYALDRPSAKPVVGLALQIRNYLGDDSYDGDFDVFEQYENAGDDWINEVHFPWEKSTGNEDDDDDDVVVQRHVEYNEETLKDEGVRARLVGYFRDFFDVVQKSPGLIDEYPDILKAFVDYFREMTMSGYYVILKDIGLIDRHREILDVFLENLIENKGDGGVIESDPSILERHPEIVKAIAKLLSGYTRPYDLHCEFLVSCPFILDKYPEIREAFIVPSVYGKVDVFAKDPSLLDRHPDLRRNFIELCSEDSNGHRVLEKHPYLIDRHSDIRDAFVDALRKKFYDWYDVIKENAGLVEKHKEIRDLLVKRLAEGHGLTVVQGNPKLVEKFPDIQREVMKNIAGGKCDDNCLVDVLGGNPYLFDQYPELLKKLTNDIGRKPYAYVLLKKCPSLVEGHGVILEKLLDALGASSGARMVIAGNPHLIKRIPKIKEKVCRQMPYGGYGILISRNPSLIDDDPDIFKSFLKCLDNGYGLSALDGNPDLVKTHPEIAYRFAAMKKSDEWLDVVLNNKSLADENPEIMNGFSALISSSGMKYDAEKIFKILEDHLWLLDDEDVEDEFASQLKEWKYDKLDAYHVLERNPVLAEKHKGIREALCECIKDGHGSEFLSENVNLIERHQDIRDAFAYILEENNAYSNPWMLILESNSSLLKYEDIFNVFVSCVERGYGMSLIGENPSLLDSHPRLLDAVLECLEDDRANGLVNNCPRLLDGNPAIKEKVVELLEDKERERNEDDEEEEYYNQNIYLLQYISDIPLMKRILDMNPNDGEARIRVLCNENPDTDESKLYKLCKEFANKYYQFLKQFFERYHAMSSSPSFQKDFWDYVEGSNYLFEIIRDFRRDIPVERIAAYANSDDEDIRWIASKEMKGKKSDRRASRIARRIYLMEVIPERIIQK